MRRIVWYCLVASLLLNADMAAQTRTLRSVPHTGKRVSQPHHNLAGTDETVVISYDNEDALEYFLTLPDDGNWGDNDYNVCFTPPFGPFYLLEAQIALFGYDRMGEPGMRVLIWDSEDEHPGELIDMVDIAFEDLEFSTVDEIRYNVVDLRDLQIGFNDEVEFHIGVEVLTADRRDTLAVLLDDGRGEWNNRSSLWNENDEEWLTLVDLYETPHNFAIRAVVTDENPWQRSRITGQVVATSDLSPIEGAIVSTQFGDSARTFEDGHYLMHALRPRDNYRLTVKAQGYLTEEYAGDNGEGIVLEADQEIEVDFRLENSEFSLNWQPEGSLLDAFGDTTVVFPLVISNPGNGELQFRTVFEPYFAVPREPWNQDVRIIDRINLTELVGDDYLHAVEFYNGAWLVAGDANRSDDNWFYRFSPEGDYLDRFAQPLRGRTGITDMALSDGELYCAALGSSVYLVDPETGNLTGSLDLPEERRSLYSLTVDPANGDVFGSTIASDIWRMRRDGDALFTVESFPVYDPRDSTNLHVYGLSWQPYDPDGFNLFLMTDRDISDNDEVADATLFKLNPNSGEIRLVTDFPELEPSSRGAASLCLTKRFDQLYVVGGMLFSNPDGDHLDVGVLGANTSWVGFEPEQGIVQPDSEVVAELTVTTDDLETGDISVWLIFEHNGLNPVAEYELTVTMHREQDAPPDVTPPGDFWVGSPHPNPFNSAFSLNVQLDRPGDMDLTLYDPAGRAVARHQYPAVPAGSHNLSIDAGELPAGLYIVRVASVGRQQTRKAVLLK